MALKKVKLNYMSATTHTEPFQQFLQENKKNMPKSFAKTTLFMENFQIKMKFPLMKQ